MIEQDNPFASSNPHPDPKDTRVRKQSSRKSVSVIVVGVIVGIVGMVLLSNRYGNTDTLGLPVIGLSGLLLGTGVSSLFLRWRYSVLVGLFCVPASLRPCVCSPVVRSVLGADPAVSVCQLSTPPVNGRVLADGPDVWVLTEGGVKRSGR